MKEADRKFWERHRAGLERDIRNVHQPRFDAAPQEPGNPEFIEADAALAHARLRLYQVCELLGEAPRRRYD